MENCESDVSQCGPEDMQLDSEFGKILIERNKELNSQIVVYKSKAHEQELEIANLRKLLKVMVEENDSRVRVYEKLDAMLQELEHANDRLHLEKCQDKDQIKLLTTNAESLEARCQELTQQLSLARLSLNKIDRYRQELHTNVPVSRAHEVDFPEVQSIVLARHDNLALTLTDENFLESEDSEDLIKLLGEMENIMRDYLTERRRCVELEDQLRTIVEENNSLQGRLANTSPKQNMMSIQEEFSLLDEVRRGQMCSRCLAKLNEPKPNLDELLSITSAEEQDERSPLSESISNAIEDGSLLKPDDNLHMDAMETPIPYPDVVETLLQVQQTSSTSGIPFVAKKTSDLCPSPAVQQKKSMAVLDMAPFALREAETSSSEEDNECSQTDIFHVFSSSTNISFPQVANPHLMEKSSREVSSIMSSQSLAITKPKPDCKTVKSLSSFFNTTSIQKPSEKGALVMKPLKQELPEHIPLPMGMKKKNRRKHHHQSSENGTGISPLDVKQMPQLQMGQCSVAVPLTRDFGRVISRRGNPTPPPLPPPPPYSGSWKNSLMLASKIVETPQTSVGHNKSEISYADALRADNSPADAIPSKFPSILSKRLQQTNRQKRY
ncbi:hypothetical protein KR038_005468 [Drosophila bunnanda]|nr:hypothetical protein KR038_005468 [Drosophila bunnanda]